MTPTDQDRERARRVFCEVVGISNVPSWEKEHAIAELVAEERERVLEEAAKAIDNVPGSNGRGDGGWEYGLARAAELVRSLKAPGGGGQ